MSSDLIKKKLLQVSLYLGLSLGSRAVQVSLYLGLSLGSRAVTEQ